MSMLESLDPRIVLPFVDIARHRLSLYSWEQIEPELESGWRALDEVPPWREVADIVRESALDELRGP